MRRKRISLCLGCLLFANASIAWAQYPPIRTLAPQDVLYKQLQSDISTFHADEASGLPPPRLTIFSYTAAKDEDLFTVSSNIGLPFSSLATLNRISSKTIPATRRTLLIPNVPGIFVADHPESDLERLLAERRNELPKNGERIRVVVDGVPTAFTFYPGSDFDSDERLVFLGIVWRFPVPGGKISSPYGMRQSPVTGRLSFHGGVDIAAPEGARVLAARGGSVEAIGDDAEFGNYVELSHEGGYSSFYGHLGNVVVQLNERVTAGMMIGTVGSTGLSTGPHLHFEIRLDGKSKNPMDYLSGTY